MCGKSDATAQFHGEMCIECAKTKIGEFSTVRVRVCQKCGEVINKGRGVKGIKFEDEVSRQLRIKSSHPKYNEDYTSVEYDTFYGRFTQGIVVLTEKFQCLMCARAGSQYFEAIVQLRGDPRRIESMGRRLIARIESRSFIPKIEELKEGIDIYCGSRNEAISALNSQELGFLRTEKLAGEKNGKRLYRTTLLVRLTSKESPQALPADPGN